MYSSLLDAQSRAPMNSWRPQVGVVASGSGGPAPARRQLSLTNSMMAKAASFHRPTMMAKAASSGLQAKGQDSKAKARAPVNRFGFASAADYMAFAGVRVRTLPAVAQPRVVAHADGPPPAGRPPPCRKRKSGALVKEVGDLGDDGYFDGLMIDDWGGDDLREEHGADMHPFRLKSRSLQAMTALLHSGSWW